MLAAFPRALALNAACCAFLFLAPGCGSETEPEDAFDEFAAEAYLLSNLSSCDALQELIDEEGDDTTRTLLGAQLARCADKARSGIKKSSAGGFLTDIDHCVQIQGLSKLGGEAEQGRLQKAWRDCVANQTSKYRGDAHCGELDVFAGRAKDRRDLELHGRAKSAYYDCKARDGSKEQRYDHCLEMRALAASAPSESDERRRLIAVYLACVDNVADDLGEADHCDDLSALAEQARSADDAYRYRHYVNAYYNCLDADAGGASCGDGSQLACDAEEISCDDDQVAVIQDGCWTCVVRAECAPAIDDDACIQLRHEASVRHHARDFAGYRRLIEAYLTCMAEQSDMAEELTCRNTRCSEAYFCAETAQGPRCLEGEEAQGCTREWAPVCGRDRISYANACVARATGIGILHEGECRPRDDDDDMDLCNLVWAPVCGRDLLTYGNECEARRAGAEILHEGACEHDDDIAACTLEYQPVCGSDGVTYSNSCHAERAGAEVVSEGSCRADDDEREETACSADRAVCGADGQTYDSECDADRKGVRVSHEGRCIPDDDDGDTVVCTTDYAPVCGTDGVTYSNSCQAGVANAEVAHEGECSTEDDSEEQDDPTLPTDPDIALAA